ncbi:CHAT domain-containing protein [Suillus ampliporus]|nr:CHAT domain-containing protein [Suillus ampliporus]
MPGSLCGQSIRLEVISGKNLNVPSWRIPAGIYVFIKFDETRHWNSAIRVLSPRSSVAWGDTVTLSSRASPRISLEIRASFELGRMLGNGEVIRKLETSWDQLLRHGDERFNLYFPPVRGVHPSLTLKATVVCACCNQDGAQIDCPVVHPDHAAALTNLACAHLQGYIMIRNDLRDIDRIISLFRDALALRPQGHADHLLSLYYLSRALNWQYSKTRTTANIHESAQLCCKLLPLCPVGSYLRSTCVDSGVDYVARECNELQMDASDEGIQLRRIVLELCPLGHRHHPRARDKLSWSLFTRFTHHGNISDLHECIPLGREAMSLCPKGYYGRDIYLNNLGVFLENRFHRQGTSRSDLDEAISLYTEALRLRPVGHEFRHTSLGNLGGILLTRFNQCSNVNDINRAISLLREALTLHPPGHQRRDAMLNILALTLKTRYVKSPACQDLNEAIHLYRESLSLKQYDHPDRHKALHNLSWALRSRFMHTQKNEDIVEAICLCQQSLATFPSLHPDRYFSYVWLKDGYLRRYEVQHHPAHLSLAVENFRRASRHPTQGFPNRIIQVYDWALTVERYSHASALEAYTTFFELLDDLFATRSSTISRSEAAAAFRYARTLPVDAASYALRSHNVKKAIELVEQGRGQQWSLASRLTGTPVGNLKSANPKLARKFSALSKRVSDAAQGFSRFLLPPSYEDLQAAACLGPVIILIASKYSCDAIIVPTSGEPHHVPFPSLTLADLNMLKGDFTRAIRHGSLMGTMEPRTELIALLRKIWDEIMLPIVNILRYDLNVKPRSRIWLCPTAAFTSIPLHAAHPFRMNADRSGRESCLEDIYICSYTPTLSALIRSRQIMKTHITPSFAAIGKSQPGAGQGTVLATVDSKLELVHKLVPPDVRFTNLSGDDATQAGALETLRSNTWMHFACHGKQDHEQPYNSRFAMRDKPLTLLDIIGNNAPQAEFAFLSACHTTVGNEKTPDEVIHLAAGLQFSGFKSVIGTLWAVDDSLAKHVVEVFYEDMFKDLKEGIMDCTKAAAALNHATYAVKKTVPLEQRIVFIHIGV